MTGTIRYVDKWDIPDDAHQLKNVRASEISSVFRGAGKTAVMLRKADNSTRDLVEDITRRAAEAGVSIGDVTKAIRTLSKWNDSEGKDETMPIDLNDENAVVTKTIDWLMKAGKTRDEAATLVIKAARKPKLRMAKPEPPDDTEPDADADDVNKAIDALIKGGLSRDQAATAVIRKARGW